MKATRFDAYAAAGILTMAVALGACSTNGQSSIAPAALQSVSYGQIVDRPRVPFILGAAKAGMIHPDRRRSWMARSAKSSDLLYVSDLGTGDVYAYSYPAGKLQGTLTGFAQPQGLCTDKAGDLFVTVANTSQIRKYAHGGTKPIATLRDRGEYPVDCSVDPVTGNLAVMNFANSGANQTSGNIAIYAKAQGKPKTYAISLGSDFPYFGDYDKKGDLFIDGIGASGGLLFAELPKGGSGFTSIALQSSIGGITLNYPGDVEWDGYYITFADAYTATVYQVRLSGSTGTIFHDTPLGGVGTLGQFRIQASKIAGANYSGGEVMFWNYPIAQSPSKTLSGFGLPYGIAISQSQTAR